MIYGLPEKQGLYDPSYEKDNCGVGFVCDISGIKSNDILKKALEILKNLRHRGAVASDDTTGDGAGIMLQLPHSFLKREIKKLNIDLPKPGSYAAGMIFLPKEPSARLFCEGICEKVLKEENLGFICWREVPVNEGACGELAKATLPVVTQLFINKDSLKDMDFERKLYVVRKRIQNIIYNSNRKNLDNFYICSLSSRTIVYKGLILGHKLSDFYIDLNDKTMETSIAVVHERYSTNTFPSWKLAQPFRFLAHNGEINTIRGNKNWMNAREGVMKSKVFGEDFSKTLPIIEPYVSDSAALDNALELFSLNNHSLQNSMMILMPEAWQEDSNMNKKKRAMYEYFARIMEPWDGPATVIFSDGIKVGVTLDRNALRPARYVITKDNVVIMASETGAAEVHKDSIIKKGRVLPGKMFLIDTKEGRIIDDEEIKSSLFNKFSFDEWTIRNKIKLSDIREPYEVKKLRTETLKIKERVFGYTEEELEKIIAFMADNKTEPMGSMGMDIPLAILSKKPQLLFNYFKQSFAQVTNPPIDPIRERNVMSLKEFIGGHGKILDEIETDTDRKYLEIDSPVLSSKDLEDIRHLNDNDFRAITLPITFEVDKENGLSEALSMLCKRASESVLEGNNILILSDRNAARFNAPIPSLLALSAVHQHLIREKLRTMVDIIVEAGDARDVMHIALLIGYGAKAVNPYMVYEILNYLVQNKIYIKKAKDSKEAFESYREAISTGLLKILSRIGISTLQSYCGAQTFQAIGINSSVIDKYFTGTVSKISGIDINYISKEVIERQRSAYEDTINPDDKLEYGGELSFSLNGENHIYTPKAVKLLRKACSTNDYSIYKEYTKLMHDENKILTLRDLLKFKAAAPISINEVEPLQNIIKRFTISGMSFGALSSEAHKTIAEAMNRIDCTSNSGEGGEDPERYKGNQKYISKVKQIASGRFGVTTDYLVNCDELQIKIAQGAKPGEGGHLPGSKVTEEIGKVRHSLPSIDLISPPPHHDIYSIEDLAELIYDLKNVNTKARISVKLVSEAGVGTVAAGVSKAYADAVMISGHDGGTGASPISSMKYVGMPWELGLSEVQQTLLLNNLRSRITLQVDGKLRSGKDIVIAALLGAEEFGFATAALISGGCIMCRKCSTNKCPAGIATQDETLRKNFKGRPEDLINFLTFIAMDVREILAELGAKSLDDLIGRVDLLMPKEISREKLKGLDFTSLLYKPYLPSRIACKCIKNQKHKIEDVLDKLLIEIARPTIENGERVKGSFKIKNTNRAVCAMLSGEISKTGSHLKEDSIDFTFEGSAGQSFGAFLINGLKITLIGDANDYLGKSMSGGKIILIPEKALENEEYRNIIAGNTLLYGATAGEAYIAGIVGERFAVRNSGAISVVEGVGDHGLEYMTGGTVVILGSIGRNFAAGMSGGIAYVLDEDNLLSKNCNKDSVSILPLSRNNMSELKELITKHEKYTNSVKAREILNKFHEYIPKFKKVVSPVYENLLEKKLQLND